MLLSPLGHARQLILKRTLGAGCPAAVPTAASSTAPPIATRDLALFMAVSSSPGPRGPHAVPVIVMQDRRSADATRAQRNDRRFPILPTPQGEPRGRPPSFRSRRHR